MILEVLKKKTPLNFRADNFLTHTLISFHTHKQSYLEATSILFRVSQ